MVRVQLLLVNAVMVVDFWVTSVASGSTSISRQSIAYTEKCDKCVHGATVSAATQAILVRLELMGHSSRMVRGYNGARDHGCGGREGFLDRGEP